MITAKIYPRFARINFFGLRREKTASCVFEDVGEFGARSEKPASYIFEDVGGFGGMVQNSKIITNFLK